MPSPPSRYHPDSAPDYSHRFHAGNVGDVWKHCALVALLESATASGGRVSYLDTHAGEGSYALAPTGEWTEGIGRVRLAPEAGARDDLVPRYLALCRELGASEGDRPTRYPGSPVFAHALLGEDAALSFWERDASTATRLAERFADDSRARVTEGDGLASLASEAVAAESSSESVVVLIDPPWAQKADWTKIPEVLASAVKSTERACFMVWYPVKSLTRPNAMIEQLAVAGVAGSIAELITTPLEHQRNRLNGSGVLLVRAPSAVLPALAAAAPCLGSLAATRTDTWSLRIRSWSTS